jgi:hypothetical protein
VTRALAIAIALLACGCRWQLRAIPEPQDASTDGPDASASPRIAACRTAGPEPTEDAGAGALVHAATLARPTTADIGRGACLGDLDGDGTLELVVLRADAFAEAYDPRTLCFRATIEVAPFARACVIDDLDGDLKPELALAHSVRFGARLTERFEGRALDSVTAGHLEPRSADGTRWAARWPTAWAFAEDRHVRGVGHVLATLDLDRDGRRELAVAGTVTSEGRYQNAYVRAWEFSPGGGCADERVCPRAVFNQEFFDALDTNDLFVASIDADPEPELAADLGCNGGGLFAVDSSWERPATRLASVGQPSHGALADVDGDGALDYLAATTPRCNGGFGPSTALRWLRPVDGAYRYYAEAPNPAFSRAAQQMVAAIDALGDRRPEALVCSRELDPLANHRVRCDLYSFDAPHIDHEWTWTEPESHPDMISRLLVADVDGDGRDEALVITQSRVHLLRRPPQAR